MITKTENGGGLRATIPFLHAFCVDCEFQYGNGNPPWLVCMVVKDVSSGVTRRYRRDELVKMASAPFETGEDAVMIAYAAQAELGCLLGMGWKLPHNVVDLRNEFRVETNGRIRNPSIIDALAFNGLAHIDVNENDVDALVALLTAMGSQIDWPRALHRGRFVAAVARMEFAGVPMDDRLLKKVKRQWPTLKRRLVAEVDGNYGVYQQQTFKIDRFSRWLRRMDIPWPRLPSGLLDLSDDAFKLQEKTWPALEQLRQLRQTLSQVNLDGLCVGYDGRSRTSLRPFASITGRNQPSTTSFAFGTAKWTRGFIRPAPGYGLGYADFSSQEILLAAALSEDERLIAAYEDGDPYLAFAKQVRLIPPDATIISHKVIRDRCKAVVLGLLYGMGIASVAIQAGITTAEAGEIVALHKRAYRRFWRWSDEVVSSAYWTGSISTVFGWKRIVTSRDKATSLMNFPMQANGAEMMRVAAIAATEAGIEVCAPVHDAFLIVAPLERLQSEV